MVFKPKEITWVSEKEARKGGDEKRLVVAKTKESPVREIDVGEKAKIEKAVAEFEKLIDASKGTESMEPFLEFYPDRIDLLKGAEPWFVREVLNTVADRYRAAGWRVALRYLDKDRDSLILRPE